MTTADNGKLALDKLEEILSNKRYTELPNLIISDIMMPVMDGFQFLEEVKSQDVLSSLPMIMLTTRADIQDKLKALRIGVDDYVLKPFVEEELMVRVRNLLKNYEGRKSESESGETLKTIATITQEDQEWLKKLEKIVIKELSNNNYSIVQLAQELFISERQLRRRVKKLVGLTPAQYFKEARLYQARELLETMRYKTIAQTANAVGFQDVSAFSKNFKVHFGKKPSEYGFASSRVLTKEGL